MKVIGKDIGTALDAIFDTLAERVRTEAGCELQVEAFEAGAFSSVDWDEGVCLISLHNGVPTHALPHVFGVALQHVRQHLDRYPTIVAGDREAYGGELVRITLRELLMAPEAEERLAPLQLDTAWETEQRHAGLKDLLREAPREWDEPEEPGGAFASLQYARFALEHPPKMWDALKGPFQEQLPRSAERGEHIASIVRRHGWADADACLAALTEVRDLLGIAPYARIEDLRTETVR